LTNGTLINSEIANSLKKIKPRGIEISLLGATPDTHDSITGVKGSFAKTIEAIRLLVERRIVVTTKTTLMSLNVSEYPQIKSLSEKLGAVPKSGSRVVPRIDGDFCPQQYKISQEERERFLHNELLDESFIPYPDEDSPGSQTCKAGKMLASINPYGDVSPCVLLPIRLGNLKEKSFKEIWHNAGNKTLHELRDLKIEDLEKCSSCQLASLCSRCTGSAYLEHKSLTAPDSSACEDAQWKAFQRSKRK